MTLTTPHPFSQTQIASSTILAVLHDPSVHRPSKQHARKGSLTGQPLQEHVLPHEQLVPQLHEPLELHPQSLPDMVKGVV